MKKIFALVLSVVMILTLIPSLGFAATGDGFNLPEDQFDISSTDPGDVIFDEIDFIRSAGDGRYATAFATASYLKAVLGVENFGTIVLACGKNFPDALAGSYLAAVNNAPIILIDPADKQLEAVLSFIGENLASGGRVYILGGTSSVSENAETEIAKIADVKRLAGGNRYETNIKILEEAGVPNGSTILVADGSGFADALSVSSLGLPVLLVKKANTEYTADQLSYIKKGNKAVVIGGAGSVPEIFKTEAARITEEECIRIEGGNRYETSYEIAKWAKEEGITTSETTITVADGSNFPDGLTGGPLAYALGAPLFLSILKNNNQQYASRYYEENACSRLLVFGGTSSVSDELAALIMGKVK